MKENESNWEKELPPPEELIPLSQTLITPHLASVLNLYTIKPTPNSQSSPPVTHPSSSEFENSGDLGSGAVGDEQARTLKRPRLVWTPQLHKRFIDAVAHLGIKNAVPKTIMQLMSVDGLTRENVASHLQKYRLYLKRMEGHSGGGGGGGGGGGSVDPVTDHLFGSLPVPSHFLQHRGQDHFMRNYRVQSGRPIWVTHTQLQQQFHQQRQMDQFRTPLKNGLSQQPTHRIGVPFSTYEDDFDLGTSGTRKVLTLFPTGEN